MIESPQVVTYGRQATEALTNAVAQAKTAGPLAPVTVIVPSNFVGLSARRLLGSGLASDGRGIANVSFLTPFRLAEQLSNDLLLDELPLTNPVLGAAVRRALATKPGIYAKVKDHHSTEAALAALFAELSNVDDFGLEAIETEGEQAGQIAVEFYREILSHLDGFHTEKQLASAAADRLDLPELVAKLGHVIWYLPAPSTSAVSRLIGRVLSDASSAAAIIGLTGVERADKPIWETCYAADVLQPKELPEFAPAVADKIVSVTDADEEIRAVTREVLAALERGVRADRIGIFYPTPDPYVRLVEQHFDASNIPANGPDRRRLADSVPGRTLLAALQLPDQRWRRDKVMALVSGAPIRHEDGAAHPSAWEVLSRQAGVHRDLADWKTKLELDQAATQERLDLLEDPDGNDQWTKRRLEDRIGDAKGLSAFVHDLADNVAAVGKARSWSRKCEAALGLLHALLGPENRHGFWPESEQDAFSSVVDALTRFGALDDMEPNPSAAVFQRALAAELDVARSRNGRFGEGVMYGPLSSSIGHDLDAVFIVGCAEGLLPVPRRDDAILPDRVRMVSLDQLELKTDRLHHQHREFLAALAASPVGNRTLLFPRGDLRSSRNALPSRWMLETASVMTGERVHATDFDQVEAVHTVPSYATGIRTEIAPSSADRDLAEVGASVEDGVAASAHPLAYGVSGGLGMQAARNSSMFTGFDGNLSGQPIPGTDQRPASPSRLETWAKCGFKYFLSYVLGLSDRDDPETLEDISALDRGKLVHAILEDFIKGEIDSESLPAPSEAWSEQARTRLVDIAHRTFDEYEKRGRTGRPVYWAVQKDNLLALLDNFLIEDNTFRAANGASPVLVELPFGLEGAEPLPIELDNGKTLRFRGLADRVDTTTSGRVIVSDYKTGKGSKYAKLKDDPVQAGQTLQLGLYAEAAMRETGLDSSSAHYWMIEADSKDTRKGYEWKDDHRQRFVDVLTTITTGIEDGIFAASPGEWDIFRRTNANCPYCDFESLCPRARGEHEASKAESPLLAIRSKLTLEDQA